MRVTLALIRQHLRDQRFPTLVWAAVLAFLSYMVVAVTPTITSDNFLLDLLKSAPPGISRLYGDLFAFKYPADAYLQFKWLMFFPLLAMIYGITAAMGAIGREVEHHTADFTFTLPVARTRLLLARFAALAINMAFLYISSWVTLWAGLRLEGLPASILYYAFFFAGAYFLTLALAAFTLWMSVQVADYTVALRAGMVTGVTLWMLNLVGRVLGGPLWFQRLTLFGWYETEAVIARGEFPWGAVLIGAALSAFCLIFAAVVFNRKQIIA